MAVPGIIRVRTKSAGIPNPPTSNPTINTRPAILSKSKPKYAFTSPDAAQRYPRSIRNLLPCTKKTEDGEPSTLANAVNQFGRFHDCCSQHFDSGPGIRLQFGDWSICKCWRLVGPKSTLLRFRPRFFVVAAGN